MVLMCLAYSLGDHSSNSSTRLILLRMVMVVVASLVLVMGVVAWSGTQTENAISRKPVWGFHEPGWLWVVGNGSRGYLPLFANFEPSDHVPQTSVRARTCTGVFTSAAFVPRNQEHEKRPAGGTIKNADGQKKSICYLVPGNM